MAPCDGSRKEKIGRRVSIPWYHKAQTSSKEITVPKKDIMVGTEMN